MYTCYKNILKCLADGTGVFTFLPTTTTTTEDPLCYLVDCEGNFIVDCQCNFIEGCPCPPSECGIVMIGNTGELYLYRFDKNLVSVIDSVPLPYTDDVAMTTTKLWVNSTSQRKVLEYNIISLDPWSMSYNRTIDLAFSPPFSPTAGSGVGLDAISNTELITGRGTAIRPICRVDISQTPPIATSTITLPIGRVEGDIYYDVATNKYYVSYIDDVTLASYFGIFNINGSVYASVSTGTNFKSYGIFKYGNVIYVVRANGELYTVNTTTAALTYFRTIGNVPIGVEITGATSTDVCYSTTSTTTTAASTTTSSTSTSTSTSSSTSTSTSSSSTSSTSTSSTSSSSTSSTSTSSTTTGSFTPIPVPPGAGLHAFGDSITTTTYVSVGDHYTTLLATDLGTTATRFAVGSSGFKTLMKNSNANIAPNTNIVIELTGLNNVTNEGNKTQNLPMVRHGVYTLLANQWYSSIVNAANILISKTGTFTGYAASTYVPTTTNNAFGGKFGTVNGQSLPNVTDAIYSSTPGSYIEYTTTFKHAFVALMGGSGQFSSLFGTTIPSGVVNIYVNGVLQTTIDLGDQYPIPYGSAGDGVGPDFDTVGPVLVPIIMPSSASRTIKVELVSGDMAIDYIATLANPASCYPVVLGEIPYVDPLQWGVGSQAIADQYSNEKLTIVNTWRAQGFPIAYADVNTYYNYVNTVDGTHPNVLGNQQVAQAFQVLFA